MADMLVKLYECPPAQPLIDALAETGVTVRRAMSYEKEELLAWVRDTIRPSWVSECDVAFIHQPVACFVATDQGQLCGFGCYEGTARGFFGPLGVAPSHQGRGIGRALLLSCLHAMSERGYGYAVIGSAGPVDFYTKVCGATMIPASAPGIYRDRLKSPLA